MAYEARVVLDSVSSHSKNRLTTMVLTYPRIVHSEFMTHCKFSRNAASSRAIPVAKQLKMVEEDPFIPEWFGKEQKGMQASEEIDDPELAREGWLRARDEAVFYAKQLLGMGMHKNIPNRLLEPFSWITTVVTGTQDGWANFFAQRCEAAAEKHFQKVAYMAQLQFFTHEPTPLRAGEWHTPFILPEEYDRFSTEDRLKVSVARVARVSYRQHDGKIDVDKDLERFKTLLLSNPKHMSPFAHIARATANDLQYANFRGWMPYRTTVPGEYISRFEPNHPDLVKQPELIKWRYA